MWRRCRVGYTAVTVYFRSSIQDGPAPLEGGLSLGGWWVGGWVLAAFESHCDCLPWDTFFFPMPSQRCSRTLLCEILGAGENLDPRGGDEGARRKPVSAPSKHTTAVGFRSSETASGRQSP